MTDTVTDPLPFPSLFSMSASTTRSGKANTLLSQAPLQFWPMRWKQKATGEIVGNVLLPLIKKKRQRYLMFPVPFFFFPALNVDVMPGVMTATL